MEQNSTTFQLGQQFQHIELDLTYKIDNIRSTDKGDLYTLVAEDCLDASVRYKSYHEQKLKEKCRLLEQSNG